MNDSIEKTFDKSQKIQVNEELRLFNLSIYRSVSLMHFIGYGLLILGLLDIVFLFLSRGWTNAGWLFEITGNLIQSVPVFLVGFGLVFFGERKPRLDWELFALRWLSKVTLLFSFAFVTLIPLGVLSSLQVIHQNEQTINQKGQYTESRLVLVQKKVLESNSSTDLNKLSQFLLKSDPNIQTSPITTDEQLKQNMLQKIQIEIQQSKKLTQTKLVEIKLKTFKNIIKIILDSLIASSFFWVLWKSSSWAREFKNS